MRQTISGLVAAFAVVAASAAPAMACGGLFGSYCSPCAGTSYVSPCAPVYAPPLVSGGCYSGCGWAYQRLAEPTAQYYYVNQGPTYSGPGEFAPYPAYEESALPTWGYHHRYYGYRWHHHYHYVPRHYSMRYGYGPHYRHWGHPVLRRDY